MFTNRNGCTIYERIVQNRTPAYIRHTTRAVYWEDTNCQEISSSRSQNSGNDRAPDNKAFISIPAASIDFVPKTGDRIVGEIISDAQPPPTAMTIMAVDNFCYGSPAVQHWEGNAK